MSHNFEPNPEDPCIGDDVVLLNIDGTERSLSRVRSVESFDYDLGMFEVRTLSGELVIVAKIQEDVWIQILDQ